MILQETINQEIATASTIKYTSLPRNKVSRKQKKRTTRAIKQHYRLVANMRKQAIEKYFPEHINHEYVAIDTFYSDSILQREDVYCECKCIFTITNEMLEGKNGREYKIITATR